MTMRVYNANIVLQHRAYDAKLCWHYGNAFYWVAGVLKKIWYGLRENPDDSACL